MARERPGLGTMIGRALVLRCPYCGSRKIFRNWFAMEERCPRCGLRFGQGEGAFLGSMSINYAVAGLAFFAYIAVALVVTMPDPPVLALTVGSVVVILVTIVACFPW